MCTSCGEFVVAYPRDGKLVPAVTACPACDGDVFKDVGTDTIVHPEE